MLARKEAGSASQGVSMARRHSQEGQVYEKGKNWIGRWREDIVQADGKIRRIRRPAFYGQHYG
jgi:hypothetical protein